MVSGHNYFGALFSRPSDVEINGLDRGHTGKRLVLCGRLPHSQSQNATSCIKWFWYESELDDNKSNMIFIMVDV